MPPTGPAPRAPKAPRLPVALPAAVLPDHDLAPEGDHRRLHYADLDLSGRDAPLASLTECRFTGTDLSGTALDRARLTDCVFDGGNLANVRAGRAAMLRARLSTLRMTGFTWVDSLAREVTFTECRIDLSNWRFSRFTAVVFDRCNLTRADFSGADLSGARFVGCDLTGTQFSNATMTGTRIAGCTLVDVGGITSWAGAVVQGQDLVALSYTLAAALGIRIDTD